MKAQLPVLFVYLAAVFSAFSSTNTWEQRFSSPPANTRILKIIHGWPDEPAGQDSLIAKLKAQGFGGVVCNVSFDQYLESDTNWQAFSRAVLEAKKAGMALWLYDERGYPSANAGGLTLRGHPDWEAQGLLIAETRTDGNPVVLELPPGDLVLANAYPIRNGSLELDSAVDLSDHVQGRKIYWAPAHSASKGSGRWHVFAITQSQLYEGTHAEGNYFAKMPYPNLLMAEPSARFVDLTYGGYAKHLGSNLDKYFEASFTDEPSLMSLFLRPMPYTSLPWAPNLPGEFKRRRGYELQLPSGGTDAPRSKRKLFKTILDTPIPALVTHAGERTLKFRYDFWQTVGELVAENYFGQIQSRCRKYSLPSGGHLLLEENIVGHVPLYGDFVGCARRLDAPSIDCLTSVPEEVPWRIARLVSSVAELEQRTLVMSESSDHIQQYRTSGDKRPRKRVTAAEIRGSLNRQMVSGINVFTSYYTFAGLSDQELQELNLWIGRCCTALRGGYQVASVAVLHPTETLWTRFIPSREWTRDADEAERVQSVYRSTVDALFHAQRDFTFVDSKALLDSIVAAQGSATGNTVLRHNSLEWQAIILPSVDTLPVAAWEKLVSFVQRGGVLIAIGELPRNSEQEFPSPKVRKLASKIFGADKQSETMREPRILRNRAGGAAIFLPAGLEACVPQLLDTLVRPDVQVTPAKSPIRVTHRFIDDYHVYFVINDSPHPWTGQLQFSLSGAGERWNPATGRNEGILKQDADDLNLGPYEAALFRFPFTSTADTLPKASRRTHQRTTERSGSQALLQKLHEIQPQVEPTLIHGEFVKPALVSTNVHTASASPAHSGPPFWTVQGQVTKSDVDTFLFARFVYSKPTDLSKADCLVIDTSIPADQAIRNRLLVVLREGSGADYIAETGRLLSMPAQERTHVPFHAFQLAGWSKDENGTLDLQNVHDIRIGWGGYLGKQGEQISFTISPPRTATLLK